MPFNTSYLETNISEIIKGNIDYIAFGTKYKNQERIADISTAFESGRAVPVVSRSGNTITFSVVLSSSTANNLSSLIENTPSSKLTFDIVDSTGFNVGDRVELNSTSIGGWGEQRKIAAISTNTITLDRELYTLPINGLSLKTINSSIYLVNGGTIAANSGSAIYCFQYPFYKPGTIEKTLTFSIDITGE